MITPLNILILILAYLIGSIPTAVWIGKSFYQIDIREHGSGNAGATNTFRILGKKAGIPVLIIDVLKGVAAVSLTYLQPSTQLGICENVDFKIALGVSAFLGHLYPIFASFRGGKGVATMLGILIALNYPSALLALLVFVIVLLVSNYVSLSAILAAYAYPLFILSLYGYDSPTMVVFSLLVSVLITITHQKNIERLINRQESKMAFFKAKLQTKHIE